jgi:glycerophosphoryl diester phosphodiesterase
MRGLPLVPRLCLLVLRLKSKVSSRLPSLPPSFLGEPLVHRGLHDVANGVQENSRPSFERAIKQGFGIELDLQMSSDGEAMVFHDYALDRLTNDAGAIQMRTAAELRDVRLKVGNDRILDLEGLLQLVDGQVPLLIELKDQDGGMGPNVGRLERRVAEILANYKGDTAVMSFNPHAVMAMSQFAPNVPRGLTTSNLDAEFWPMLPRKRAEELAKIPDFGRTGACFVSHNHEMLDGAPVTTLRKRGVPILCWTVRSQEQENKARRLADNITFEGYIPEKHIQSEDPDV